MASREGAEVGGPASGRDVCTQADTPSHHTGPAVTSSPWPGLHPVPVL